MTSNLIPQRQGTLTRIVLAEEVTKGDDAGITQAYIAPMSGESGFEAKQENIVVPIYTGDRTMDNQVYGLIMATGPVPLDMDFIFSGRINTWFWGRGNNYTRPWGAGVGMHRWTNSAASTSVPSTIEVENDFLEATAQTIRHRAVYPDMLAFKQNLKGGVSYQLSCLGSGDVVVNTTLASLGAAVNNDGPFTVPNFFNGVMFINNTATGMGVTVNPRNFTMDISNNCSREEAAFLNGLAASVNFGKMTGKGQLDLLFATDGSRAESNLAFMNYAKNQTPVQLEWWIFDGPPASWTKFFRVRAWVNFLMQTPKAGGDKGRAITQLYNVNSGASSTWAGELYTSTPGPWTLPATPNLGLKIDGGSTLTCPLTVGAQTATQVAAGLNAYGPFNAVATATVVNNGVMIKSNTRGAASSVQVDAAVATPCHTQLSVGYGTVLQSGYANTAVAAELFTSQTATF